MAAVSRSAAEIAARAAVAPKRQGSAEAAWLRRPACHRTCNAALLRMIAAYSRIADHAHQASARTALAASHTTPPSIKIILTISIAAPRMMAVAEPWI